MRRFRNHGIDSDHRAREAKGAHAYDMIELGYNYRLSDLQCALGLAQLTRLAGWVKARQAIAAWYDEALTGMPAVIPLKTRSDRTNAHHLYVVKLALGIDRDAVFSRLRSAGIGANVHYSPVYLHSFYRNKGYERGIAPIAETVSEQLLTLPMFPAMKRGDVGRVVEALAAAVS
jgi:perosamine synthetase